MNRIGQSVAANDGAARASAAVDNLRAVVIVLVVAFHSVLAYLSFLPPHPYAFSSPPYLWRAFPVVDDHRWLGFDLFCAWLDVFLMSLFLLLSGLFAWPSLARKGPRAFLADRVVRLGVPFAAVVLVLMPLAHYPVYLQTAAAPNVAEYWRELRALPLWPSGPMWFLWILLVGDIVAAGLYTLMAGRREIVLRLSSYARRHPARFLGGMVVASAVAYIPLALIFGPSEWAQRGPFSFQLSRPLHYAVYFFAGVAIGACGIERGLVMPDGALASRWRTWVAAAPVAFAVWAGLTGLTLPGPAPLALQFAADLSFVAACFTSCLMVIALALRFGRLRSQVLDSLKANAYGMYLVHYLFVVWLQYALLSLALAAIFKATIVFAVALALSWSVSAALRRVPAFARILGAGRRRPAAAAVTSVGGSPAFGRYRGSGSPAGGGAAMGGR